MYAKVLVILFFCSVGMLCSTSAFAANISDIMEVVPDKPRARQIVEIYRRKASFQIKFKREAGVGVQAVNDFMTWKYKENDNVGRLLERFGLYLLSSSLPTKIRSYLKDLRWAHEAIMFDTLNEIGSSLEPDFIYVRMLYYHNKLPDMTIFELADGSYKHPEFFLLRSELYAFIFQEMKRDGVWRHMEKELERLPEKKDFKEFLASVIESKEKKTFQEWLKERVEFTGFRFDAVLSPDHIKKAFDEVVSLEFLYENALAVKQDKIKLENISSLKEFSDEKKKLAILLAVRNRLKLLWRDGHWLMKKALADMINTYDLLVKGKGEEYAKEVSSRIAAVTASYQQAAKLSKVMDNWEEKVDNAKFRFFEKVHSSLQKNDNSITELLLQYEKRLEELGQLYD